MLVASADVCLGETRLAYLIVIECHCLTAPFMRNMVTRQIVKILRGPDERLFSRAVLCIWPPRCKVDWGRGQQLISKHLIPHMSLPMHPAETGPRSHFLSIDKVYYIWHWDPGTWGLGTHQWIVQPSNKQKNSQQLTTLNISLGINRVLLIRKIMSSVYPHRLFAQETWANICIHTSDYASNILIGCA